MKLQSVDNSEALKLQVVGKIKVKDDQQNRNETLINRELKKDNGFVKNRSITIKTNEKTAVKARKTGENSVKNSEETEVTISNKPRNSCGDNNKNQQREIDLANSKRTEEISKHPKRQNKNVDQKRRTKNATSREVTLVKASTPSK